MSKLFFTAEEIEGLRAQAAQGPVASLETAQQELSTALINYVLHPQVPSEVGRMLTRIVNGLNSMIETESATPSSGV